MNGWYSKIIIAREARLRVKIAQADRQRGLGVASMLDRSPLVVAEKVYISADMDEYKDSSGG
jgi:hypothetical protein